MRSLPPEPCLTLQAEVMTVHHPAELGIEVMSLDPDPVEVRTDTADTKSWRLRGLLPGQGISFWWRPVANAGPVTQSVANGGIKSVQPSPLSGGVTP